jgi:hypothetical protein
MPRSFHATPVNVYFHPCRSLTPRHLSGTVMAITSVKPGGIVVWPEVFDPQPTTVPSDLSTRLWAPPAAMAITLFKPGGVVVSPEVFDPQPTTVPSDLRARLWLLPTDTATLFNPSGTVAFPKALLPEATTVPSDLSARIWLSPAAIETTLSMPAGLEIPRVVNPRQTKAPFAYSTTLKPLPATIATAFSKFTGTVCWESADSNPQANTDVSHPSPTPLPSTSTQRLAAVLVALPIALVPSMCSPTCSASGSSRPLWSAITWTLCLSARTLSERAR